MLDCPGFNLVRLDREVLNADGSVKTGGGIGVYANSNYDVDQYKFTALNASN